MINKYFTVRKMQSSDGRQFTAWTRCRGGFDVVVVDATTGEAPTRKSDLVVACIRDSGWGTFSRFTLLSGQQQLDQYVDELRELDNAISELECNHD